MKNWLIVFVFILSLTLVSAIPELTINQNFQPGETALGVIVGPIDKQITSNDFQFYQSNKEIFLESDVIQYNNTYYFYIYFTREGNFTLKINNLLYRDANSNLNSISFSKDFYVSTKFFNESNKTFTKILSIQPGFIFTSDLANLTLSNKGTQALNLTLSFEGSPQSISLNPQETKRIEISPNTNFSYINISSYNQIKIPVIYLPLTTDTTRPSQQGGLKSNITELQIKLREGESITQKIDLLNFDEQNITNMFFSNSIPIISLTNKPTQISAKNNSIISLSISSQSTGFYQDNLIINYTENTPKSLSIPISVFVFPKNTSQESLTTTTRSSCAQLGGIICSSGQDCNGIPTYATDGYCCKGACFDIKTNTSSGGMSGGFWIGFFLILIFLVGGFFVYRKFKKAKPINPEDKIKESTKLYEKRVSGSLSRN